MKKASFLSIVPLILSACGRLESIPYSPEQTPESWLLIQPFVEMQFGQFNFILVQPSSTIFVYLLGIITISIGLSFLRIQENHQSRKWWGIALVLWGLGALCAGTSYQAFSFEIKCAGKAICSWTSWWEIIYLILSVASIDAMLISGAYASWKGKLRQVLINVALFKFAVYCILVLIGILTLNEFLISFELLLIVTTPDILFLFILNGWRYLKYRDQMDAALAVTWIWLGAIIGIYFIYLQLGFTEILWERGIWFSENDVLHLGLISWMLFIGFGAAKLVRDRPTLAPG